MGLREGLDEKILGAFAEETGVQVNDIRCSPAGTQLDMFGGVDDHRAIEAMRGLHMASEQGFSIDATLQERGSRYGDFDGHARITQALKEVMRDSPNWDSLPDSMKESLDMQAHKIGRILNGDPNYKDSWTDIVGYARLVEKML